MIFSESKAVQSVVKLQAAPLVNMWTYIFCFDVVYIFNHLHWNVFCQEKPVVVRTPQAESKTIKRKLLPTDPTDDEGKWVSSSADWLISHTDSQQRNAQKQLRFRLFQNFLNIQHGHE